ncbi:armadillo segment polarity protein-like isoform X2 [Convolutriloba macropyga]|uniref:armadillo segment polarity protein-like isoform X2 n=1 Tax=Convolutriloba macropyga TaxID=536237 RepID=UPI003F526CDF
MQCQSGSSGAAPPPNMVPQQMTPRNQQPVPMEHYDSAGSQMCPPGAPPPGHPVASRVPHQHPQMQQAPGPQPTSNFGPMNSPGNYDQMMQMLVERQEHIKMAMNDPANQQQLPQLRMQLAQNTQEMKNLSKQQQQSRGQPPMYYQQQQQQQQAPMQSYGPPGQPGGPHMIQQAPPPQQATPHGYMDMNVPHAQPMMHHPNAPHQPMMNKSQSVAAWQHQNYMLDSGLNSGHSTAPPSLCSNGTGNELLDNEDADSVYSSHASWSGSTPGYPQACYTPEQFDNFSGPRSVGGMYYESGPNSIPCETPSYPSPQQFDPNNPQSVPPNMVVQQGPSGQNMAPQQMGGPAQGQMPRQTLKDAISQIAQMLDDGDSVVQLQAAETAQAMAKNPQNRPAIIQSSQMIQNLVNALNSDNEDIVRCAAGTLHDLSQMKAGLLSIFKCGGIQALIALLQSPREAILFYAITTLHNLLLHQDGAKSAVALASGIPILVGLLKKHSNVKFLAITVDCLRSLGYGNQNNKEEILKADGPSTLVKALTSYEYEKLLWTISRVLKVLSVCPKNKQAIVAAGGVHALAFHLNKHQATGTPSSPRLIQNCLWTLRNISDVTTQSDSLTDLLQKLIPYVKCTDPVMSSCAVCILSNLLCNNVNNKIAFVQLQGIQALLFAIDKSQQVEDLVEPALCALRHATSRHSLQGEAQTIIRQGYGLHCVIRLMDQHMALGSSAAAAGSSSSSAGSSASSSTGGVTSGSKWPVLKAAVGLLRNMCTAADNLPDLVQHGAVMRLVNVIKCAQTDWQRRATAGQEYRLDGVKMEDIVEGSIGALHLMVTKSQPNQALYRSQVKSTPMAITIFVQMLASNSRSVLRVTCSLLAELALDHDGAEMIKHTSNLQPLGGLIDSNDQHISEASNLLFQRLTAQNQGQPYNTVTGGSSQPPSAHGAMPGSGPPVSNFALGPPPHQSIQPNIPPPPLVASQQPQSQHTSNQAPPSQASMHAQHLSGMATTHSSGGNSPMPPHGQSDFTPMDVSAASSSSTPGPQPQATVGAGGLHPSQTQGFGGGGTGFSDLQTSQSNMQGFGGSSQMNMDYSNLPNMDMTSFGSMDDFVIDDSLF